MKTYPYQEVLKSWYDIALKEPIKTFDKDGEVFFFVRQSDLKKLYKELNNKNSVYQDDKN